MLLIAAVVINITMIDAPQRSASAIVKNCPDSMKDWNGAAGLTVVGRPIFSKHVPRRPLTLNFATAVPDNFAFATDQSCVTANRYCRIERPN